VVGAQNRDCRGCLGKAWATSNSALSQVLFLLLLLVGFAQLLGFLLVRMRQPKVVGEILAGILLGPALLERLPYFSHLVDSTKQQGNILDFVYWLGLLLLMFLSGAETPATLHPRRAPRSGLADHRRNRIAIPVGADLRPLADSPISCGPEWQSHFADHYSRRRRGGDFGSGGCNDLCRSENSAHQICAAATRGCRARRHHPVACARAGHGNGRASGGSSAGHGLSPARHRGIFSVGAHPGSPPGEKDQPGAIQCPGQTIAGRIFNRGCARLLRGGRSTGGQPGIRRVSRRLCRGA
jgi:Sodium/hydrogen exchanger family